MRLYYPIITLLASELFPVMSRYVADGGVTCEVSIMQSTTHVSIRSNLHRSAWRQHICGSAAPGERKLTRNHRLLCRKRRMASACYEWHKTHDRAGPFMYSVQ